MGSEYITGNYLMWKSWYGIDALFSASVASAVTVCNAQASASMACRYRARSHNLPLFILGSFVEIQGQGIRHQPTDSCRF